MTRQLLLPFLCMDYSSSELAKDDIHLTSQKREPPSPPNEDSFVAERSKKKKKIRQKTVIIDRPYTGSTNFYSDTESKYPAEKRKKRGKWDTLKSIVKIGKQENGNYHVTAQRMSDKQRFVEILI